MQPYYVEPNWDLQKYKEKKENFILNYKEKEGTEIYDTYIRSYDALIEFYSNKISKRKEKCVDV